MNPKRIFAFLCSLCFLLLISAAPAQTAPPTLFTSLQNLFDAHGSNSLMNAGEVNLTPMFKWDTANHNAGGAAKVDWWVSPQQGAFFTFEEFANGRQAHWAIGYQARTVFKGIECSLGVGTRQNTSDPLGDVRLFITPTLTKQIYANGNWDIRLTAGADVFNNGGKPNPFFGVTFRAVR